MLSRSQGKELKKESSDSPQGTVEVNNTLWHIQIERVAGQEDLPLEQLESQKKPQSPIAKVFLLAIQLRVPPQVTDFP